MMRALMVLAAVLAVGCNDFESPKRVIDFRILGVVAEPPEILVPTDPAQIELEDLAATEFCALVADPADSRGLQYRFEVCRRGGDGRCALAGGPILDLGGGEAGDPEEADAPISLCASMQADPVLLQILEGAVAVDSLQGFGAIDVQVGFVVWPDGVAEEDAFFATKAMRYGLAEPEERTPNQNPSIARVIGAREANGARDRSFELPRGRCGDVEPFPVSPGEEIALLPEATEGSLEDYVVPTFDGDVRRFTENLRYQFYTTAGDIGPFETGGPRDFAGNVPTTDSSWTAPEDPERIGDGLDVQLWIIQRDERGGQSWFLSCARVVP